MMITAMQIRILTFERGIMTRFMVSEEDWALAAKTLSDLIEDLDGSNRFMLKDENVEEAEELLDELFIDYDII